MFLNKLELENFRNYRKQSISLKNGINIFIGKNGVGKTNILESIYFLALTKSHRIHDDLVLKNHDSNYFKVTGNLKNNSINNTLEISYYDKKKYKIDNNEIKKIRQYMSYLKIIIFFPDDLDFIKGLPDVRRKYINIQIGQIFNSYIKILDDYNKLLKSKNEYIKKKKYNENYDYKYFEVLNEYFIKKSILIFRMRKKYIDKINNYIDDIFYDITGIHGLKITYAPIINFEEYIEEEMYKKIKNDMNIDEEISYGKSIYGPHRDDFKFILDGKNLKFFGSQGQQRAAVLALKLSEIMIFTKVIGSPPILLLDDVFSELDETKKNNLLKYISNDIQTIITTTDIDNIDNRTLKKSRVYEIDNGIIKRKKVV